MKLYLTLESHIYSTTMVVMRKEKESVSSPAKETLIIFSNNS